MKNMTKFQLIITIVFAFFIVIGVITFSLHRSGGSSTAAHLTVWGFISDHDFNSVTNKIGLNKDKSFSITYEQKSRDTLDHDLVEAIANGTPPDIFFLPQDLILKEKKRIFTIPYANYPARTFKDSFIEEGELFLTADGVLGLPITIDPMVMYWNRDIFANASLAEPPRYWDEFYGLSQKLTKKDGALNITESAVALGESANITNSKKLISALMMQAGTPITQVQGAIVGNVLTLNFGQTIKPAEAAVNFYTQFSDPTKDFYSWNRSLPPSQNFFVANTLGIYFGFASELSTIRSKNPNLNFDVAPFPQTRNTKTLNTFGNMDALAITKTSKNISSAFALAQTLTSRDAIDALASTINLPPVRRDVLNRTQSDPYLSVFYNSAIISHGWLDPDPVNTDNIFQQMIDSITSGRRQIDAALSHASTELSALLEN